MKKGILVVAVMVIAVLLCGCGAEELGWFTAGGAGGIELSRQANENAREEIEKASEITAQLKDIVLRASVALNDPNIKNTETLISVFNQVNTAMGGDRVDEQKVSELVTDAIKEYHNTKSTIAVLKEEGKEPMSWVALGLGLIAAYQKKKRTTEAKTR